MTATDELRRLLDERGVEHVDGESMTYINDADFIPAAGGTFDVTLYERTPAQAIDATLGRGECRVLEGARWEGKPDEPHEDATGYDEFYMVAGYCTGCGEYVPKWRYCPNCGRRVIS